MKKTISQETTNELLAAIEKAKKEAAELQKKGEYVGGMLLGALIQCELSLKPFGVKPEAPQPPAQKQTPIEPEDDKEEIEPEDYQDGGSDGIIHQELTVGTSEHITREQQELLREEKEKLSTPEGEDTPEGEKQKRKYTKKTPPTPPQP